jgi:predicted Rossmann fold flavoprotein
LATKQGTAVEMYGNFIPGQSADELRAWFVTQAAQHPRRSLVRTLSSLVPDRFAESLCRHQACESQTAVAQVPRPNRDRLLNALTHFHFPIIGDRGWNVAEVTAGGVPLEDINYRTMESKLVPGLYLLGEMLDCDGRIGGFNFQWAWATGWLAGKSVVRSLLKGKTPAHPASSLE